MRAPVSVLMINVDLLLGMPFNVPLTVKTSPTRRKRAGSTASRLNKLNRE